MEVVDARRTWDSLKCNAWYSLKPSGEVPGERVGHTASFLPEKQQVVLIGGATPSKLFDDVWLLDMVSLTCWPIQPRGDYRVRYEHSVYAHSSSKLWVFAGANMEENMNDLWELDVDMMLWKSLSQYGKIPSPRTYHMAFSVADKQLSVFGGGLKGPDPVLDTHVYQLDPCNKRWTMVSTFGPTPLPRHGHIMVSTGELLFCHGGMAGQDLLADLHVLNSYGQWETVPDSQIQPCARAAHGAVYHMGSIYMFGGLGNSGVLNDLWKLNTASHIWEQIVVDGPAPPGRLDFAMALVHFPIHAPPQDYRYKTCILLHGGMNNAGDIFDDFYVFILS